jgi:GMP synthase-like glutamine amidotransferase
LAKTYRVIEIRDAAPGAAAARAEQTGAQEGRAAMPSLCVIQHTSAEYLGLIEDHLEGRGIRFRYFRPFTTGGSLPKSDAVGDGLVLLGGGPWGSAGARDLPTLEKEVSIVRTCLERERPVIGIGLGAQILALAAGGGSEPAALKFEVTTAVRTLDAGLNGYLPERYPLALYMRDWPVPPDGARILARDPAGRAVLWQVGRSAFGFAGHPGLKVAMVEDLIMEFDESPEDAGPQLDKLRAAQHALEDSLVPMMTGLVQLTGWMELGAGGAATPLAPPAPPEAPGRAA